MKTLLTIELHASGNWYMRSVLLPQTELPTRADIQFYYERLLGVEGCEYFLQEREVPDTFPISHIATSHLAPKEWPQFDKHLTCAKEYHRYCTLLDRMAEMERLRSECGVTTAEAAPTSLVESILQKAQGQGQPKTKYARWVQDLLKAVQVAEDPTHIPDTEALAWLFTPVLEDARDTRGCRIITDAALGQAWANRVGTELYPDIVLCRRIASLYWRHDNEMTRDFVGRIIAWYLDSQQTRMVENVSPWIRGADAELATLLAPFQTVGVGVGLQRPLPDNPLGSLLLRLEEEHIVSRLANRTKKLYIPTKSEWVQYIRHVFRAQKIRMDLVELYWKTVEQQIDVWVRGKFGLDVKGPAVVKEWEAIWNLVMYDQTASERFALFLDSLNLFTMVLLETMTATERTVLLQKWVQIYIESEMEPDAKCGVNCMQWNEQVRLWLANLLPILYVDAMATPQFLTPTMAQLGYLAGRKRTDRVYYGLKFKHLKHLNHAVANKTARQAISESQTLQLLSDLGVLTEESIVTNTTKTTNTTTVKKKKKEAPATTTKPAAPPAAAPATTTPVGDTLYLGSL